MCGEKGGIVQHPDKQLGSPPRVRGKDSLTSGYFPQGGITPACAGKSNPGIGFFLSIGGSPPRVRGKVCWSLSRGSCTWITPACAGKRALCVWLALTGEDHPRVCGEKTKKAHKIKDFDPVPIRFHLVFRRFERWCSNLPTPDGNVPV